MCVLRQTRTSDARLDHSPPPSLERGPLTEPGAGLANLDPLFHNQAPPVSSPPGAELQVHTALAWRFRLKPLMVARPALLPTEPSPQPTSSKFWRLANKNGSVCRCDWLQDGHSDPSFLLTIPCWHPDKRPKAMNPSSLGGLLWWFPHSNKRVTRCFDPRTSFYRKQT